jgi:hypothetical protein
MMQIKPTLTSIVLGLASLLSTQAANITVGYQNYNAVYLSDATTVLPETSLVWLGSWADSTNVSATLSGYLAGTTTLAQLNAAFTIGATQQYSYFGDGSESISTIMSDAGLVGRPIDMVFWNSPAVSSATQAAAFRWGNSAFPDGSTLDTEVSVANALPSLEPDIAVSVIFGTAADSGTDGLGTITTIPEPSSASLMLGAAGILFSRVLSRNKNNKA